MNTRLKLGRTVRATLKMSAALSVLASAAAVAADEASADAAKQQGAQSSDIEEVFVTARRREESAHDVPIALSVIDDTALQATGSYSLNEVQRLVPSLQVFSFNPRNTNINIRGLGSNVSLTNDGLENGVGFYIDDVYYGRVGQTQFDLVDLDQIEVLRGPQGTLFGKNTTAGAVTITTKRPSFDPEYEAEISAGDHGRREVRASATGPIVDDRLAYRLTYALTERDGYIYNVATAHEVADYENTSVRGQLLFKPTEGLDVRVIGDYSKQDAECCIQPIALVFDNYDDGTPIPNNFTARIGRKGYVPASLDPFERRVDADAPFQADMESFGGSINVDWDLDAGRITSITAYRGWDWFPKNDADSIGLAVFTKGQQQNEQRQFSQEIRFANAEGGAFDYVVGAYYLWQRNEALSNIELGADAPDWFLPTLPAAISDAALNGFGYETKLAPEIQSHAVFAQGVWHLNDRLDLTTGLRYSRDEKQGEFETYWVSGADLSTLPPEVAGAAAAIRSSFNPQQYEYETELNDDSIGGLVSLSYDFSEQVLGYVSAAIGSKSGGLNLAVLPVGVDPVVEPEEVVSYELGLKTQLLDSRLTFNTAAFWTEIDNYQTAITEVLATTAAFRQYVANTGKVRSRGLEADFDYDVNELVSINAAVAWADAYYVDYKDAQQAAENLNHGAIQDLSGEPLAGAPEITYSVGGDLTYPLGWGARPLEVYGSANYSYRSEYYTAISNSRYSLVDGYGLLTARVGLRRQDGRWDASIWAKNLTGEDYFVTLSPANTGLVTGVVGEPRYVGLTLRTSF
jgi:iron complex outermembrane receptor protein